MYILGMCITIHNKIIFVFALFLSLSDQIEVQIYGNEGGLHDIRKTCSIQYC